MKEQRPAPSWLSRLLFSWVTPLIKHSKTTPITDATIDLLPALIDATSDSNRLSQSIKKYWHWGYLSILLAIITSHARIILKIIGISIVSLTSGLSTALLLREVLRGLDPKFSTPIWFESLIAILPWLRGWNSYSFIFSIFLACSSVVSILATHHLFYIQPNLGARIRAALNAIIFAKALRQQRASQQQLSTGFILNLVATDTNRIQTLFSFFHSIWHHPTALICIVCLLYRLVGSAALVGSSALLLILLSSTTITRKQGKLRNRLSKVADHRIGITRETLIHIKAAKLQGWETRMEQKIQALREDEIKIAQKLVRLSAVFSFSSGSAPAIAMAITAICLVYQGVELNSATIFPVLTLFMQLRFSLNMIPETIYNAMEAFVASKRIHNFLSAPEASAPHLDTNQDCAVSLIGLQSRWSCGGRIALIAPHLEVPRGELIVVVGAVGSGKSGLLLTILGELEAEHGSVSLGGPVAYVPQVPWIVSDSIRNNILFGKAFDAERLTRAISAAGLKADLIQFPHGDETEIGERGINLSGGQRHRVALARALYSDAEIYLFDDPLSSLDANVAQHVFSQLICGELKGKTRILVSHRVEFALAADRVLVIENGSIIEDGPPDQLRALESRFASLLNTHLSMTPQSGYDFQELARVDGSLPFQVESSEASSALLNLESGIIEAEERQIGSLHSSTIRSYAAKIAPGLAILTVIALFLGRQGAAVATDLWLTSWANQNQIELSLFLSGYLISILILCCMVYLRTVYILSRGLQAGAESHKALLHGVIRAPLSFFEANPVGRILNRFSRDLETVELSLPRSIVDAAHCLVETAAVSCIIAFVAPITLALLAPIAVSYFLLSKAYRPVSRELQRLSAISLSPIFAMTSESLSGIESLRASALGESFNRDFEAALNVHTRTVFTQTAANRWLGVRLEILGSALIFAVGVVASLGWSAATGIAFSGLALAYASSMTSSMNWAIRSISMVESSLTSFERIERYSSTEPERSIGNRAPSDWPKRGEIKFSGLSVRYRPHLPLALKDITLTIPAGSRVGIIGRTGSGKSTLILALLRLLEPCRGSIEIDGIDISSIDLNDLRRSLAVVPQEPVLFSGTLRDSLDPFGEFSDREIESALERVELKSFLTTLPYGLTSEVREGGFNFSNGQRQLICLARALLRRSKVVILDEATASIDVHTDHSVQRTIRREFTGTTLLVIAHRLATIADSDLILALRDGQMVAGEINSPDYDSEPSAS